MAEVEDQDGEDEVFHLVVHGSEYIIVQNKGHREKQFKYDANDAQPFDLFDAAELDSSM